MPFKPSGSDPTPPTTTTAEPTPTSLTGEADAEFSSTADVEAGDGSHVSSIRLDDVELPGEAVVRLDGGPPPPTKIDPEDFHKLFCGVFRTASELTGFRSLDVTQQPERAEAAARAWYETCEDVPWLRFMIQPGNKWIGRGFAIGSLFGPMAVGVAAELRERRKAPAHQDSGQPETRTQPPQEPPQPANDLGWVPNDTEAAA